MTTTERDTIVIGLGEMQVTGDDSAVLTCLGLGSCIGLIAHDLTAKVGGMAHIVLPESGGRSTTSPAKFADTAIPGLLEEMEKHGALKRRLVIKIAGGAQMSLAPGNAEVFRIGERNAEQTKEMLSKYGLRLAAEDISGHNGRSLRLYVGSGRVTVTSAGTQTQDL